MLWSLVLVFVGDSRHGHAQPGGLNQSIKSCLPCCEAFGAKSAQLGCQGDKLASDVISISCFYVEACETPTEVQMDFQFSALKLQTVSTRSHREEPCLWEL